MGANMVVAAFTMFIISYWASKFIVGDNKSHVSGDTRERQGEREGGRKNKRRRQGRRLRVGCFPLLWGTARTLAWSVSPPLVFAFYSKNSRNAPRVYETDPNDESYFLIPMSYKC